MRSMTPAGVRARLDHPVIDVDGHLIEQIPELQRHLRETLGREAATRLTSSPLWSTMLDAELWQDVSEAERRQRWLVATPWWGAPGNALDRATALMPALMARRLDDFGIDFSILYPSLGLVVAGVEESELRQGGCRALNNYLAEATREYSDRMTVPATIPMDTPQEALDELEHATATLRGHTQEVCGLEWSLDGTQLASGGNDNLLNIWDERYSQQRDLTSTTPLFRCEASTRLSPFTPEERRGAVHAAQHHQAGDGAEDPALQDAVPAAREHQGLHRRRAGARRPGARELRDGRSLRGQEHEAGADLPAQPRAAQRGRGGLRGAVARREHWQGRALASQLKW